MDFQYTNLSACHFAPKVHRPNTEETSDDIHCPHNSQAYEHSFHLLPQAMEPRPGCKNQRVGQHKGPQVAMKDQGQWFVVGYIVNFLTQVLPSPWL